MECLLLLVSLPQEDTGHLLAEGSILCHLLAQRLTELYCLIPSSLDPTDIHSYSGAQWRCVFTMKRRSVYAHFICGYVSYLLIVNIHPEGVFGFAGISSHRTVQRRASRFLAVRMSTGSSAFWTSAMSSTRKHQGFDKIIILC